jgi:hypothetical protein
MNLLSICLSVYTPMCPVSLQLGLRECHAPFMSPVIFQAYEFTFLSVYLCHPQICPVSVRSVSY